MSDTEVPKLRILLIDDDQDIVNLATLALGKNFEVAVEMRGSRAVATALDKNPDLILLDVHMPNIDGYEVLAQLKSHPLISGTPVMCASADHSEEARARATVLGAVGFIRKPFNSKELGKDVQSLLKSLNIKIESTDANRVFWVAYNEGEKNRILKEKMSELLSAQKKVLVVSWLEGGQFFEQSMSTFLEDESLVYLQIKPALLTKFPYLQELAPIVTDMISFLQQTPTEYTVLFDEPSLLFELQGREGGLAKIFAFNEVISKNFSKTCYFATRSRDDRVQEMTNQMSKVFVGKVRW